jgi:fluoride exporter
MSHVLLVGTGRFIGSIPRYRLGGVVHRWVHDAFPAETLVVNVLGCFVLGGVMYLVEYREFFGAELRVFVTIGILGGFTTFSTFGYETVALLRDSEHLQALASVAANLFIGTAAVAGGWIGVKALGI